MTASKEQVATFIATEFPQSGCVVNEIGELSATVSLPVGDEHLRPGGTISGPTLMSVADLALYVALLGHIGIVPLAVTTSLTINFLRKPAAGKTLIGQCKLLKVGRLLATGEVYLYSEGSDQPVAHAVGSYAIPPQ